MTEIGASTARLDLTTAPSGNVKRFAALQSAAPPVGAMQFCAAAKKAGVQPIVGAIVMVGDSPEEGMVEIRQEGDVEPLVTGADALGVDYGAIRVRLVPTAVGAQPRPACTAEGQDCSIHGDRLRSRKMQPDPFSIRLLKIFELVPVVKHNIFRRKIGEPSAQVIGLACPTNDAPASQNKLELADRK